MSFGKRLREFNTLSHLCLQTVLLHIFCTFIEKFQLLSTIYLLPLLSIWTSPKFCCMVNKKKKKTFTISAYVKVMYLPRGASSISLEEMGMAPNNYLALKSKNGKYYLNGNWHLDREGIYRIAGAKFIYRRSYNRPESLTTDGPIAEDLVLEVGVYIPPQSKCFRGYTGISLSIYPSVHPSVYKILISVEALWGRGY